MRVDLANVDEGRVRVTGVCWLSRSGSRAAYGAGMAR